MVRQGREGRLPSAVCTKNGKRRLVVVLVLVSYQGVGVDYTIRALARHALIHHGDHLCEHEGSQGGRQRHVTADLDEILCAIDGHREELDHRDDVVKQPFGFPRQALREGGDEGGG